MLCSNCDDSKRFGVEEVPARIAIHDPIGRDDGDTTTHSCQKLELMTQISCRSENCSEIRYAYTGGYLVGNQDIARV